MTCVDRSTPCIMGFGVMRERTWDAMQQVVDDAPPAVHYVSNGFSTYAQFLCYAQFLYSSTHAVAPGKSQTFSVEGDTK